MYWTIGFFTLVIIFYLYLVTKNYNNQCKQAKQREEDFAKIMAAKFIPH